MAIDAGKNWRFLESYFEQISSRIDQKMNITVEFLKKMQEFNSMPHSSRGSLMEIVTTVHFDSFSVQKFRFAGESDQTVAVLGVFLSRLLCQIVFSMYPFVQYGHYLCAIYEAFAF